VVQELALRFGVDWPHLTAQIISFSIVCALLYRLAYTPVLTMLAERRKQIAQGLENAAKIDAALAAIADERKKTIAAAQAEAAKVIADAHDVAVRIHAQEMKRAQMSAEQIISTARRAASQEHDRMLGELRGEVGRLVVRTTAVVTGKVLTADDQRRLTEEAANSLTKAA